MVKILLGNEIRNIGFNSIFGSENYLISISENPGIVFTEKLKIAFYISGKLGFNIITITAIEHENLSKKEFQTEFGKIAQKIKKSTKAFLISVPPSYVVQEFPIEIGENAQFGTISLDLTIGEKDIFNQFHTKHRNKVRRAIKLGVQIKRGVEYSNKCYELIAETLIRENVYFESKNEYNNLAKNLSENIEFFIAEDEKGKAEGAAVIFYNKNCAYYLWGGTKPKLPAGTMNLLHFEIIKFFINKGVKYYDFVGIRLNPEKGSKLYGIKSFKERFGGKKVEGYVSRVVLNKSKFIIYKIFYLIINKTKFSDRIDSINNEKHNSNL